MIVAYNLRPELMGINPFNPKNMPSISKAIANVKKTIEKAKTQVVEKRKKQEQQKKIVPLVMIAGAGIAGIMIFKKMKKGKKTK